MIYTSYGKILSNGYEDLNIYVLIVCKQG
uniref:Uncharacterized protein n=1 Tax=Rhizophora mucronata TaxID=61149 RepID=A0A2P2N5W5_RHIMU